MFSNVFFLSFTLKKTSLHTLPTCPQELVTSFEFEQFIISGSVPLHGNVSLMYREF